MTLTTLQEEERRKVLEFFIESFTGDLSTLAGVSLRGLQLSTSKLTILDLDGHSLYDDINIIDSNKNVIGSIRTSAYSRKLPLIDNITIGKPVISPQELIERARSALLRDFGDIGAKNPAFVCYGYPYIGVRFTVNTNSSESYMLYNPYSKRLRSRWTNADGTTPNEESGLRNGSLEGEPFYSILSNIPEAGSVDSSSEKQWSGLYIESIRAAANIVASTGHSTANEILSSAILATRDAPSITEERISVQGTVLPVSLIAQETDVFCAVASAQMILDYIGIERISQSEIASILGTNDRGTPPDALVEHLNQLSGNIIKMSTYSNPTFIDIKGLFSILPMKSGIPGHARTIRGWKEYSYLGEDGRPRHSEKFLVINDPQPVGVGQIILENVVKPIDKFYRNISICNFTD